MYYVYECVRVTRRAHTSPLYSFSLKLINLKTKMILKLDNSSSMIFLFVALLVSLVSATTTTTTTTIASNECTEKGKISISFHGSVAEGLDSISSNIWGTLTSDKDTIFYVSVSDLMGANKSQIQSLVQIQRQLKNFEIGLDLDPIGDDINDYSEEELKQLVNAAESRLDLESHNFKYVRLPWRSFSHRVLRVFQETLGLVVTESSNPKDNDGNIGDTLNDTFQEFSNGSIYLVFDAGRLLSEPLSNRVILQGVLAVNIASYKLKKVSSQNCLTGDPDSRTTFSMFHEKLGNSVNEDEKLNLVRSIAYSLGLTVTLTASVISLFRLSNKVN